MSDRMSDRSPSPHARTPQPSALAEAMGQSKSSGLIRRLSRGAHNKLRRRASTQASMRMRDQSAGPVLTRRRSDSNGASEFGGQDVSDFELDSTAEDAAEDADAVYPSRLRQHGLGIGVPRPSDVSSQFEGGVAETDPSILQAGTYLLKLTKKKRKNVRYWLDSTSARVCWYGKTSLKSFGLDDVQEVRKGVDSRNARDDIQVSLEDEHRLLTIVYTDDRSKGRGTRSLHLLMPDHHIMDAWLKAVNRVVAERVASMKALSLSTEKSEKAMNLLWRQAIQSKSEGAEELFTIEDARRFCRQLQINCNSHTVAVHFNKANSDRTSGLTYPQYRNFVNSFKERKDIQHIYSNLKHGLDSDLELDEFMAFLKNDQGIDVGKDRAHWEDVFDKFARPAQNRAALPDADPDLRMKTMSMQGLQNFLYSGYNSALQPVKGEATLDKPLNEYFISSSHNTYLLGHQVRGTSSVEGYIDALIGGCRCVEIDCWDGENGRPMVTHGRTMTTKIPFEDCVSVIAKYAFHSSPYPLIISLEVHCSAEQQSAMVDLMTKYFDHMMVTEPILPNVNSLPSPEELRGRILIKVKAADDNDQSQLLADASNGRSRARSLSSAFTRSPSAEKVNGSSIFASGSGTVSPLDLGVGTVSTPRGSTTSGPTMTPTSSAEESDEGSVSAVSKAEPPRTSKIIPKLGRLGVYTQGISFPKALGFSDPRAKSANHIFSFSEDTFNAHCKKDGGNRDALEKHNMHYLMRVYPGRRRIWSSNFNPLSAWRRGAQMAALNWQTYDVHQQVNRAMFAAGTDCLGYVLKPEELRHPKHIPIADILPDSTDKKNGKGKKVVRFSVDIISAQRLPRPREVSADAGMNPYIEFEMYAADDKAQGNATGEGGTDASAPDGSSGVGLPLRKRTKTAFGNGFDPSFDEAMTVSVTTKHPALIFVRWTVWHQPDGRKAGSNPVQLATFTAKLSSLQQGWRHLPLYNPQGDKYQEAKLFVKIKKEAPKPYPDAASAHSTDGSASPRPDLHRQDRSWPRRIFSRNTSERRRDPNDPKGMLSRTSSMDRETARS
jgi:phosphatidylinositol phospholipase C, delta